MIENLKRVREPVAWAVLALMVSTLLLGGVRLAWTLARGELSLAAAFATVAPELMNLTVAFVQVALVCVCLFVAPSTPRALLLARWSAVVVTLGTVLTLVAAAIALGSSTGMGVLFAALGAVLDVALKALAAVLLWLIARAVGAGRLSTPAPAEEGPALVGPTSDEAPTWSRPQASGSVWRTAAEAAAGAQPAAATEAASGVPEAAPFNAASAWAANPHTRPGAAEALGWHRPGDHPTSTE